MGDSALCQASILAIWLEVCRTIRVILYVYEKESGRGSSIINGFVFILLKHSHIEMVVGPLHLDF